MVGLILELMMMMMIRRWGRQDRCSHRAVVIGGSKFHCWWQYRSFLFHCSLHVLRLYRDVFFL